jgi:hypothetical protein
MFDFYGIPVYLTSNERRFLEFAKRFLGIFIADSKTSQENVMQVNVEYGRPWSKQRSCMGRDYHQIGESIYFSDKQLMYFLHKRFSIRVSEENGDIRIQVYISSNWKEWLGERFSQRHFYECAFWMIRYGIVWPVLDLLQRKFNAFLIHATACEKKGRPLIFAGLNEVGKSTLGFYFVANRGYKILCDNFLIIAGKKILPFPEILRLKSESYKLIGIHPNTSIQIYGRRYSEIDRSLIGQAETPGFIFFVYRSHNATTIEPIGSDQMLKLLQASHSYLREFPEYGFLQFAFLARINSIGGRGDPPSLKLSDYLRASQCFLLGLKHDGELGKVADKIEKII